MLTVISFGEALIDMLSTSITLESGESHESFIKFPGGAPANVAAAIGKLKGKAVMVGMVGDDQFGNFLIETLSSLGVNTEHLLKTNKANTPIAFVSLDSVGERSFTFYRAPSADLCFRADDFNESIFNQNGFFHFCSNTLTHPEIRQTTMYGIGQAKKANHLVSFDVNLRHNLWPNQHAEQIHIHECMSKSDIVKLSLEELTYLRANTPEQEYIVKTLAAGTQLILVTDGGNPLRCYSATGELTLSPPKSNVVDATAAGDAFVGGLLYSLAKDDITRSRFQRITAQLTSLLPYLKFANACGALTVRKKGAISTLPNHDEVMAMLTETNLVDS